MVISVAETKNYNSLKDNTQEIVELIRNYTSYLVLIKLPRSFPTWKRTLVHIWKNLTRNVLPISLRAWTPMMP